MKTGDLDCTWLPSTFVTCVLFPKITHSDLNVADQHRRLTESGESTFNEIASRHRLLEDCPARTILGLLVDAAGAQRECEAAVRAATALSQRQEAALEAARCQREEAEAAAAEIKKAHRAVFEERDEQVLQAAAVMGVEPMYAASTGGTFVGRGVLLAMPH